MGWIINEKKYNPVIQYVVARRALALPDAMS